MKAKPFVYSVVIVIGAALVFRHLYTGGWLTNHYLINDPNVVNLGLAIVESIAVLEVMAYWIWPRPALYTLLVVSFVIQLVILAAFVAFFLFFAATWKPKLM